MYNTFIKQKLIVFYGRSSGGVGLKIAICDDIKTDAESVHRLIRQYEAEKNIEIDCRVFYTYEDMLRSDTDFDVFILDYKMPGMNGMDFARMIRETYTNDKTVIFVTSFPEIVYDAFEVRTHRFLIKPIDKAKLFLDAFVLVLNLIGQILMSWAYMDQWYLWNLVNIFSILLWTNRLMSAESDSYTIVMVIKYSFYLLNSINGLRIWLKLSRPVSQPSGEKA